MTRCLTTTLGIAALMVLSPLTRADVAEKVKEMQSPADSKQFAMKAAEGGMLEVKLSQLAQQKTQDPQIKSLAQQLEQDHTQANQQLMAIAKPKNIDLPNDLKGEASECYQAFQKLDGKDFDNAYLLFNVKDHLKDIMMFQKEAQNGTDQEIKQWASQTLPHLQHHAQQIGKVAQGAGFPVETIAGMGGSADGARPAGSTIRGSGSSGSSTGGVGRDTGTSDTGKSNTGSGTNSGR